MWNWPWSRFRFFPGLDDCILPYAHFFINNNVTGSGLLNLTVDDLYKLHVEKLGHQEIVLEALEALKNLVRAPFHNSTACQFLLLPRKGSWLTCWELSEWENAAWHIFADFYLKYVDRLREPSQSNEEKLHLHAFHFVVFDFGNLERYCWSFFVIWSVVN